MATKPDPALSLHLEQTLPDTLVSDARIDRILDAVRDHLGVEIAFVARYIEGDRQLLNVSTDLELPMGPGYREPRELGYCWHIAEGRLPELIQNPADHPLAMTLPITEMLPIGCHLNTPLRLSDGTLYGSFCAVSRQVDRTMTERDLSVLKAFAALACEQIESQLDSEVRRDALSETIGELIRGEKLTIVHQPIVDLATDMPVGVECLARFPDAKERGPDRWFDEAGEIGLGIELEMLAVRSAIATLAHVPAPYYASVNVSPDTVISGMLEHAIGNHTSDRLVIEVTEHHHVEDYSALKNALEPVRKHARIAIDDVGAGYAGLRHLVDLQPDMLKLDMSLTRNVHTDPARNALAGALVHFAEAIGSTLVAEGIECVEERDRLAELGVTYGQGWFYHRPMPVVAAQQLLLGSGSV